LRAKSQVNGAIHEPQIAPGPAAAASRAQRAPRAGPRGPGESGPAGPASRAPRPGRVGPSGPREPDPAARASRAQPPRQSGPANPTTWVQRPATDRPGWGRLCGALRPAPAALAATSEPHPGVQAPAEVTGGWHGPLNWDGAPKAAPPDCLGRVLARSRRPPRGPNHQARQADLPVWASRAVTGPRRGLILRERCGHTGGCG
jgi:hypothetical protein